MLDIDSILVCFVPPSMLEAGHRQPLVELDLPRAPKITISIPKRGNDKQTAIKQQDSITYESQDRGAITRISCRRSSCVEIVQVLILEHR